MKSGAWLVMLGGLCFSLWGADEAPVNEKPVGPDTAVPPQLVDKAKQEIAKLASDGFDERQAAAENLKKLDLALLPWLKKYLDEDKEKKGLDTESRDGLLKVMRVFEDRNRAAVVANGTAVKLELKDVTFAQAVEALEKATGNSLTGIESAAADEKARHELKLEGTYWECVSELLRKFPPKNTDTREPSLIPNDWNARMGAPQNGSVWRAAKMAAAPAGVAYLRVVKTSLEQEAIGQALVFTLQPHLESRYRWKTLKLKVDKLTLDGGEPMALEDAEQTVFDGQRYWASQFQVRAPLKAPIKNGQKAELQGRLEYEVAENQLVRLEVAKDAKLELMGGSKLAIKEATESKLVVAVTASSHEFRGQAPEITCYNANGEKLTVTTTGTRHVGSTTGMWSQDITLQTDGKATAIEIALPAGRPKVSVPVLIKGIPLPVMDGAVK